jgi:hypothetical protein
MPNSPLDGSFESSKKRLKPKWVLALIALIATGVGGGVFAVAINLNNDSNQIEFGQGVANLVACDEDLTITPTSFFDGVGFKLESIIVSDLDESTCGGKTLIVNAYSSASATVIDEMTTTAPSSAATDGSITFSPAASPSAVDVALITIESED